jgi:hypothetical protein
VQSIADFKKDLQPIFEDILEGHRIRYRYHKSDKWFRFPWSRESCRSHRPRRSFVDRTGDLLFNEVTLITEERYKEGIGRVRVRGAPFPQIASSGTPEGKATGSTIGSSRTRSPELAIIYGDVPRQRWRTWRRLHPVSDRILRPEMIDAYLRACSSTCRATGSITPTIPIAASRQDPGAIPGLEWSSPSTSTWIRCARRCGTSSTCARRAAAFILRRDGKPMKKLLGFDQVNSVAPGVQTLGAWPLR